MNMKARTVAMDISALPISQAAEKAKKRPYINLIYID